MVGEPVKCLVEGRDRCGAARKDNESSSRIESGAKGVLDGIGEGVRRRLQ